VDQPAAAPASDLDRFFDLSTDMLCIAGQDGVFKRVNQAFQRTLGYDPRELCERPFLELVHPEDRSATQAEMERLDHGLPTHQFENRYRARDGEYRCLSWVAAPIPGTGTVYAVATDVTERKRSEQALRNSELQLRESQDFLLNVINTLADPVFVKDEQHRWVVLNEAFCRFMGRQRTELLGRSDYDFFPKAQADVFWEKDALVFASGVAHENEEAFTDSAGETHTIATKKAVFVDGAGRRTLVGVIRDVTARKRAAEEVRRAKEAAESASRAKSDFLANMSHELRTPLHAVLGFARVLEGGTYGQLNDRQRHFLGNIVRSSDHMLSLINDLLDLRRVEENRTELDLAALDARLVLEEAVSLVRPVIEERKHAVTVEVLGAPRVEADRRALLQILVNLITNAAKFTAPGGTLAVRAVEQAPSVRIEVQDNGVGIAPEDQGKLFEYFSQVGAKHAHGMKGSGVGLALTKALVLRLGGSIAVESAKGRGSTFHFTIPASTSAARAGVVIDSEMGGAP
jgi:PAS domain S-box-containing protein